LKNPPNDARDFADALKKLEFDVDLGIDLALGEMQSKVAAFARRAQTADVALAFFAGHGVQAPDPLGAASAVNYLLPTDIGDIRDAAELSGSFLVTARDIVARLQGAGSVRILILDACRDNPIPQRLASSARSTAVHRGLTAEPKTSGTLIAYSTQPNTTAADGDGRNSEFMKALLGHIADPGLDIRLLFADVRRDVIAASHGAQTPETSDSLDGRFAFTTAVAVTARPAGPAADEVTWRYVKDTRDPELLRRFIADFPASPRRREAEERVKMLEQTNVTVLPVTPNASTPGQGPSAGKIAERAPSMLSRSDEAQKVVLYEEDLSNPNGAQSIGAATWRTERTALVPGQKPEVVIRGDIEIPHQKVSVHLTLSRNEDKQLPASHVVEIKFNLPPEFSHGGIANVPGILMKQGETMRGIELSGVSIKVMDNFFLMGLSLADSEMQRNIQLLKERSWFDIPIVYGDGKRALIAVEKGPPGERAFAEAFAAWEQTPVALPVPAAAPPPGNGPAAPVESGGYIVQLQATRSEADAQTAFRQLQAKYPSVLGSRQPLIRRRDQGERGIFFVAQIGPFSARSEADQFCEKLKSAGGSCFVQRN
jgi:uncharacterized caspase-like protein